MITSPKRLLDQRGAAGLVLMILLLLLVGFGGTMGGYYWQRHKIADLNSQIATLKSKTKPTDEVRPSKTENTSAGGSTYVSQKGVKVILYAPAKDSRLASPVGVVGKVPGNWSFEASFPILLKDSSGNVVAKGTGTVLDGWMTDQLVWFSAQLTYSTATSGSGTLLLQKDNPSGLAANDDSVSVSVRL